MRPPKVAVKNEEGTYDYHDDPVKMDVYKEEIKVYVTKQDRLKHTDTILYNIIWDQCSRLMKIKLQTNPNFQDI